MSTPTNQELRCTQGTNAFKVSRRYTSQVLDDATGLYYYNARYYDPVLGRFIEPDEGIPHFADPQSYNRYAYCLNDPLRKAKKVLLRRRMRPK
jgi:RHS repeat-associated protein